PRIVWNATISDFSWFDVDFPGSGSGIDCPDNVYRTLALNGTTEYELTGKVYDNRAAQFSFQLTPHPGFDGFWTTDDLQDIATLTMLTDRDIEVDENGEFSILLGPGPGDGRKNYIQMPKGKNILLIRDTLSDWRQVPNHLSVTRIGGDPLPDNAP